MLVTFEKLSSVRNNHPTKRIVLVGGCYDLLHIGHVQFLEKCRSLGDILVVAVSSDMRIQERKGTTRPIIPASERVEMLSALRCVDYATVAPDSILGEVPTVMIIQALRPHIFATTDNRMGEYQASLLAMGTETVPVSEVRLTSTTIIIEKVLKQH